MKTSDVAMACGAAHLQFQHSAGRNRKINTSSTQPDLHSVFHMNQNCIERPCLKKQTTNRKPSCSGVKHKIPRARTPDCKLSVMIQLPE